MKLTRLACSTLRLAVGATFLLHLFRRYRHDVAQWSSLYMYKETSAKQQQATYNTEEYWSSHFLPKKHNRTNGVQFQHPRAHPYIGARFENGSYGFVANPYLVRRTMMKLFRGMSASSSTSRSTGTFLNMTLTPHGQLPLTVDEYEQVCNVSVGRGRDEMSMNAARLIRPGVVVPTLPVHTPSILCVVYTHAGAKMRVRSIIQTWGWRCDGFFAASTVTEMSNPEELGFGSIDLVHLGEEAYHNMWQKTRSILAYLYEHYLDEFDYFHLAGDDVFLIPENFKYYLSRLEAQMGPEEARKKPLHIGNKAGPRHYPYVGGGSGYSLNREALRFFNEESGLMNSCNAESIDSAEDRLLSRCFQSKNVYGLEPVQEGTQKRLLQGLSPHWIIRKWRKERKIEPVTPEHVIANETMGWHIIVRDASHPLAMKRYHAHFYRSCPSDSPRARSIAQSPEFLNEPVTIV